MKIIDRVKADRDYAIAYENYMHAKKYYTASDIKESKKMLTIARNVSKKAFNQFMANMGE